MKQLILMLILGLLISVGMAQQRPITSTYMFNGLALNPAYAGSQNLLTVSFVHRKQWVNLKGSPQTQIFAAHNSFYSNQIGVGFYAKREKIGVHNNLSFYGSYAYKLRTDLGIIALGLSAGLDNHQSNYSELTIFPDNLFSTDVTRLTPNFGTGVYLYNPKSYFGVSVPYLLENRLYGDIEGQPPNSRESRYYYFTGGTVFDFSKNIKFSPSFLVSLQEQNKMTWNVNALVIFEGIAFAGFSYRWKDALIVLMQLILNENFRVGYAYDATVSNLARTSSGTHEVLLNYRIKLKNYKKDPPM